MVRDKKHGDNVHAARVVDCEPDTHRCKRMRLVTGPHNGEVLLPGEYDLLEFTD